MIQLGEVSIASVVEINRSFYPTPSMLPDSTPDAVARHYHWLKPDFFDESVGDLASRIQTWIVRTPRHTVLIDTGVGNDMPVVEAGRAQLVEATHELDPWLRLEPSPRHTPGHVCVRLTTSAGQAVFSGDLMHRTVQVAEPQWSSRFCYDGKRAAATRREFIERHTDSGVLILAAHFPRPGYIVRAEGGHRFVAGPVAA